MRGFENRPEGSIREKISFASLGFLDDLDGDLKSKLYDIINAWNFYCGYHWEGLEDLDGPQVTVNYCRAFVNKFVSFELGKSFTIGFSRLLEKTPVTQDGRTLFEYMEDIWEDNKQYSLGIKLGLMKSITGEAWIQVVYQSPEDEDFDDPYGVYAEGRLRLILQPTTAIFPEYDPHDAEKLVKVILMYEYDDVETSPYLRRRKEIKRTFKRVWTKDKIVTIDGDEEEVEEDNPYGVIPFVRVVNLTVPMEDRGVGDLEDLIPMNSEYNLKKSDVSEIIDYHASPITLVYGTKVGNLEKAPNKVWGGLPKDAKVENLESLGDLSASQNYIESLKVEMCEVAGIPETVLGGASAISNTSGVALQYINLPLVEKTRVKRKNTEDGLEDLNRLIIHISLKEDLIRFPNVVEVQERDRETGEEYTTTVDLPVREMFYNEVSIPDTLPKDELIDLQMIQQEMSAGLESRHGAMVRLGKENIEDKLAEIDEDRRMHPEAYTEFDGNMVNSGMTNGQTPEEEMTKETTGANGGAPQ